MKWQPFVCRFIAILVLLGAGGLWSGMAPAQGVAAQGESVAGVTGKTTQIAAGNRHTCVLTSAGGVKCWGDNQLGQLGDGTQTKRTTPVNVVGLTSGVQAIAAAGEHTCALITAGPWAQRRQVLGVQRFG